MCASLIRQTLKIKNPRCYPGVAVVMQRGGGMVPADITTYVRETTHKNVRVSILQLFTRARC